MANGQIAYNTTRQVKGGSTLTGSRSSKFLRNKYQTEIDNAHIALVNEIHHVEKVNRTKTLSYYHRAQALKEGLKAHYTELEALEATLDSLLAKSFGQEYKMWKENTQGLNIRTTEGLGGKTTNIMGQTNATTTLRYLEKYPEHSSHPDIQSTKKSLETKLKENRVKEEQYYEKIADFNHELPYYTKNVQKCQDNIDRYYALLQEGMSAIQNSRYVRGFFFMLLTEDKKADIMLDTIKHPMVKWKNIIEMFQKELNDFEVKPFQEMLYNDKQ